jgi:PadR family transcriptional regulator PadR
MYGTSIGFVPTLSRDFPPNLAILKKLKNYLTPYTVCDTVVVVQCMRHSMTIAENLFENLRLELRRGCLSLAVLAQLRVERYGYTLRKALADDGLVIDESTLYPLLRRLEAQGLLASEWREEEKRNKRFYRLTPDGEQIFAQLLGEWQAINASVTATLNSTTNAASNGTR